MNHSPSKVKSTNSFISKAVDLHPCAPAAISTTQLGAYFNVENPFLDHLIINQTISCHEQLLDIELIAQTHLCEKLYS